MLFKKVYDHLPVAMKRFFLHYFIVTALILTMIFWSPSVVIRYGGLETGIYSVEFTEAPSTVLAESSKSSGTQYNRVGLFTAYTSRRCETDSTPYITADGTDLRKIDFCVIANDKLKFGTLVEIEGIGKCNVRDRFGKGHGEDRFDIYFRNGVREALNFGKKELKYRIIK